MKSLFFGFSLCFMSHCFAAIKIGLDWLINPLHLLLIVGLENGFFKEANLDVELVPFTSYSEATRQLMAHSVDLIILDESRFYFYAKKHPLKAVHTLIHQPLEVMVSHKPLRELKGAIIGHQSSGIGLTLEKLSECLSKEGLSLNDIALVMSKQNLSQSFIHKKIDASLNIMRPFALSVIKQHVRDVHVIAFDHAAGQILVGQAEGMAERMIEFQKLGQAIERARSWILANPKQAIVLFKKKYPEQVGLFTPVTEAALIRLFEK